MKVSINGNKLQVGDICLSFKRSTYDGVFRARSITQASHDMDWETYSHFYHHVKRNLYFKGFCSMQQVKEEAEKFVTEFSAFWAEKEHADKVERKRRKVSDRNTMIFMCFLYFSALLLFTLGHLKGVLL